MGKKAPSNKDLTKLAVQLKKCGFKREAMSIRDIQCGHPRDYATAQIWGLSNYGNSAGVVINEMALQNIATAYACITLRAQILSCLPARVYKKTGEEKDYADQHPANWMWNDTSDDFLTAFNVREAAHGHVLMRGNSYFEIGRNFRGQAARAYLLDPRRMNIILPIGFNPTDTAEREPDNKIYRYQEPGRGEERFDRTEIIHVANWSGDGFDGWAPLSLFRESLGLTAAANRYTSEYFKKGGYPLGFLTKPGITGTKLKETVGKEWEEWHSGVENSHKVGFLSGGLDWRNVGFNNNDSQLLQLREFQKKEMAQIFRTPLALLADNDQPISNIEYVILQFIIFTLLPDMKRWEGELDRTVFTPRERAMGYCIEHDPSEIHRCDLKTLSEVEKTEIGTGLSTPNEIRRKKGKKGYGEVGDKPLIMSSQYTTLEAVASGLTLKMKQTSSGSKKSDQPDSNENRMINRVAKAYAKMKHEDREKAMSLLVSLNGQGQLPQ